MAKKEAVVDPTTLKVPDLKHSDVLLALQSLFKKQMNAYKQELMAENDELLDRALRKYSSKVARRSWHVGQKWCKWNDEGPILMPDHTRLYYRKGNTEVIVQEFAPQVRLMKFTGGLAKREDTDTKQPDAEKLKTYNYSLALPYIIFIFKFVDGVFSETYVTFSDRPLKKLQEKPLRPYLSNLDSNLKLCLGASFIRDDLIKGDLVQQVALVLNNFWSTVYSDEWSSHYWNNKKHFSDIEDSRMSTLEGWQEASMDNPLFVIEDVKWLHHTEESFGDMVVRLFENDSEDASFRQELYNDLVDNFLDEVKNVITDNFKTVESKGCNDLEALASQLLTFINESSKV